MAYLAAVLVLPRTAQSQQTWDPHRYAELVQRVNYLSNLAQDLPEEAAQERHELLTDSARVMQEALEMLRLALFMGELDQYGEAYVGRAQDDLYQGYQRLITLLIDLGYCQAAQVKLEEAVTNSFLLPDGAAQWLESMRSPIERCVAEGLGAPTEGVASAPDAGESPTAVIADETQPGTEEDSTGTSMATGGVDSTEGPAISEEHRVDEGGPGPWPWILIGSGAALAVTGIIYDFTLHDELDEFDSIQSDCDRGACDGGRLLDLESTINDGKIIIGSLVGAGIVAGCIGVVLLCTSGGEDGEVLSWTPMVDSDRIGVVWTTPF